MCYNCIMVIVSIHLLAQTRYIYIYTITKNVTTLCENVQLRRELT